MFMTRLSLASLTILAVLAAGFQPPPPSAVVNTDPVAVDPGTNRQSDIAGRVNLGSNGAYLRLNHVVGNGVGWQDGGFTTIGGWVPFNTYGEDTLWWSDLRVFVTNDGHVGQNAGGGFRVINEDIDRLFGGAFFYDGDYGQSNQRFNQFSGSLETLGPNWDARLNAYFPVGNDLRELCGGKITGTPFFQGNRILFPAMQLYQQALQGADTEFGVPILGSQWFRAYGGYYWYHTAQTTKDQVRGFRGRLEAQVSDDLSLMAMVTNDHTFGTNVNGVIDIRLGGGRPNRAFPNMSTRDRMYLPVQRNYRVAINQFLNPVKVAARDPVTKEIITVAWVDNSQPAGGNGTYEHPFQNLPDAETIGNANMILVRQGTGATYDGGIILKDNQRLLGEGLVHQFDAYAALCKVSLTGTFDLPDPGFTNTGLLPTITNSAGNAVTLANNNEVSAFNITMAQANGITGSGIDSFDINNVHIDQSGLAGIALYNASGTGFISDSTVDNNTSEGILISNVNTNPLDVTMDNISSVTGNTLGLGLAANNSSITATINGYLADSNAAGLDISASNGGTVTGNITDSTFDNSTAGDGIKLTSTNPGSAIDLDMTNTTAFNSFGNGYLADSSDTGTINTNITGGDLSSSGLDAIRILADNSVGNSLTTNDTPADDAGVDGLHVELTNNSIYDIHITNGSFMNAGNDAFDLSGDASSTLNISVDPTPSSHAAANGIRFNFTNTSTLNGDFADTDLSFAGQNGVLGFLDNNSTGNLLLTRSKTFQSGIDALHVLASNGSHFDIQVDDGDLSHSGQDGIDLTLTGASVGIFNATNTPVNLNTANGLLFDVESASTLTADVSTLNMSQNGVSAINGTVNGLNTSATLTLDSVNGSLSGLDGFNFNVTNGGNLVATGQDTSLLGSGNHGIRTLLSNGATAAFSFDNAQVTGSAADGLFVTGTMNSVFTGSFTNSSFANSGTSLLSPNRNAVEIAMDNSSGTLNLINTVGNNSGQNGLLMTAQNGANLNVTATNGSFNISPVNAVQANVSGNSTTASLTMTNTDGNNAGADAIRFNVNNNAMFTANVTDSDFNNAGVNAVHGVVDNGATATFNMSNFSANLAQSDGALITVTNGSTFNGDFKNGSFQQAGQDLLSLSRNAVELNLNNATSTLNMDTVDGSRAGGSGFLFTALNASTLNSTVLGSDFSDAGKNAINGTANGNGTSATIDVEGSDLLNAKQTGVELAAAAAANLDVTLNSSDVNGSGDHGIHFTADGLGTTASLDMTNTNVNNNGLSALTSRDGINLSSTNGAVLDLSASGGDITNNRNSGIRANADGAGSQINITIDGTGVDNNRREDGLTFSATSGASITGDFSNGSFVGNGQFGLGSGIDGTANGLNSSAILTFDNVAINGNTSDGLTLTGLNSAIVSATLTDTSVDNNFGYGINLNVDGPNTIGTIITSGTTSASNNTLGGVNITASNGAQLNGTFDGTFSGNKGTGINIAASNTTINSLLFTGDFNTNIGRGINVDLINSTVSSLTVQAANIIGNTQQGLRISAIGGSNINNGLVTTSTITGNGADGFLFMLDNSTANLFSIDSNLAISNNTGNGIHVDLNTSPTNAFSIRNNVGIAGNQQNGIFFDLDHSDLTNSVVDGNTITGNQLAGVQYTMVVSNLSGAITNNTISQNLLSGIGLTAQGGLAATSIDFNNIGINRTITGNTITGNGNAGVGAGILATVGQNVALAANVTQNTISNNQSFGLGVTSTDGSVTLNIGGATSTDGNTFDNNVGVGINLGLQDSATGTVDIENNTITRTQDNGNATFQGDGINIRLGSTNVLNPSTAQLVNSVISNNTIGSNSNATLGNEGRGIAMRNDGNSLINNLTMDSNTVVNNQGTGLQMVKDGNANITNVEISNSTYSNNTGDGIELSAGNGTQIATYDIHDNTISSNTNRGIHLDVQADSRINADLTNNDIQFNGSHGIEVTEASNDPTDQRQVTGTWIQNTITNNVGSGIALNGAYGTSVALVIGQNGLDINGQTLGNTISSNGGFGISSNAIGVAQIVNNTIALNGTGGVHIDTNKAFGNTITLDNNVISSNTGDGLELRATNSTFLNVVATRNSIVNNTGRGVDVLNQVNATTFLQFGDGTALGGNLINNNSLEGFYVVNTASATQNQTNASSVALAADGALDVTPDIVMDLQYNTITNNGSPGAFPSSGLVLRVGTSNASTDIAGNGAAGVGNAGLNGNGRVNARVINNRFGGNFGTDVLVESFRSTVNPPLTQGIWDDTTFQITPGTFAHDPLARLNMVFHSNMGDAVDVTRGQSDAGAGDPSVGAFYQSNDPIFKSRDDSHVGLDPDGPFLDQNRRRNAQRLASNVAPYNVPGFPGAAAIFTYDGVGASTFRVESNYSVVGFTAGDSFIGDTGPVPPPGNANGVPFTNNPLAGPNDELPFGWDNSVAPGTFQFLIP